jgi:hypothetical protein
MIRIQTLLEEDCAESCDIGINQMKMEIPSLRATSFPCVPNQAHAGWN